MADPESSWHIEDGHLVCRKRGQRVVAVAVIDNDHGAMDVDWVAQSELVQLAERAIAPPQGRVLWQSKTQTPSFGQIIPTPGYSDVIAPHVDVPPGTEVAVVVLSSRAEEDDWCHMCGHDNHEHADDCIRRGSRAS